MLSIKMFSQLSSDLHMPYVPTLAHFENRNKKDFCDTSFKICNYQEFTKFFFFFSTLS